MLFDTHAHYDAEQFDGDRDEVLSALPLSGVGLVVNPGCDLDSSQAAAELAARYGHVYAAVGYHPENCGPYAPGDLERLRALAGRPKVVAIGEIGLDYHWEDNPPRELPGDAKRLPASGLYLPAAGGDQGRLRGGVRPRHGGKREALFPYSLKFPPPLCPKGSLM